MKDTTSDSATPQHPSDSQSEGELDVLPQLNRVSSGVAHDGGAGGGRIGEEVQSEAREGWPTNGEAGDDAPNGEALSGNSPSGGLPGGGPPGGIFPGQRPGLVSNVKQTDFDERERKVIDKYAEAIKEYRDLGRWYLKWHRIIGIALLVCSVLAPVLIASNHELLGFETANGIIRIAVIVSVMVALFEGIRRIFKFDERAAAAYLAQRDLVLARERYRRIRLRYPNLSPERLAAFEFFWATYYEDIYFREVAGWTKTFKDDGVAGDVASGKARAAPKAKANP